MWQVAISDAIPAAALRFGRYPLCSSRGYSSCSFDTSPSAWRQRAASAAIALKTSLWVRQAPLIDCDRVNGLGARFPGPCGGYSARASRHPRLCQRAWHAVHDRGLCQDDRACGSKGLGLELKATRTVLRHACGYALANKGPTQGDQGWLGHRSITSTAVYTALAPNRFRISAE